MKQEKMARKKSKYPNQTIERIPAMGEIKNE
jgi:hypothetical protein